MINEVAEAKRYIDGNIGMSSVYRACFMMAQYYRMEGLDKREAFQKIADWIYSNNVKIEFSPMQCVISAFEHGANLRSGDDVYISDRDKEQILKFAYTKKEKMLALAFLCCAKSLSNEDGCFNISLSNLAYWINERRNNLYRQLKSLTTFGFVEQVEHTDSIANWNKTREDGVGYKVLVPYDKGGTHRLVNNDIFSLYDELFG